MNTMRDGVGDRGGRHGQKTEDISATQNHY
jgi:hypothetical protein